MPQFKLNHKQCLKDWNLSNPKLKQKNSSILAEETGLRLDYISTIGKRYKKEFNVHFTAIFASNDNDKIKQVWREYLKRNLLLLNNIEKIRVNLGVEITDLIKEIQK